MERVKARLVAALCIYMNGVDNIPFFIFFKKGKCGAGVVGLVLRV